MFKDTTPAPAAPAEPAPGDKPKAEGVDDLFKETSDPAPAAEAPAPEAPKAEKVDDLFSDPAPSTDKSTDTTSPNPMRRWTDNTGKYQVVGRLVMVSQTHVRILKDTGKYTTVPLTRLSQGDLAFVRDSWTGSIASW